MKSQIILEVERILKPTRIPVPEICFTLKGVVAGTFVRRNARMYLNFNIPLAETNPSYIDETVVHEVAHYVAHMRGIADCHGANWKRVMVELGASNTNLYHNYDVSAVTTKYSCGCRTHYLTKTRHNKILKGGHCTCKSCGNRLEKICLF